MRNNFAFLAMSVALISLCSIVIAQSASEPQKLNLPLDQALAIALENNTLITQAIENKKAAVQEMKSAKADFFPKASFSYRYTGLRNESSANIGDFSFFGTSFSTSKDKVDMDFALSQPIFTGFALSTTYKMAKLGIGIRGIEIEQAKLDVVMEVKVAYYNILLTQKFLGVAQQAVTRLESHERDAKAFYRQGVIAYNDLLRSTVALADAIQAQVQAHSDAETAVAIFNTLLRLDINQPVEVLDLTDVTTGTLNVNDLIAHAIAERPELKSLELQLDNAGYAVKLAKSSYYPQAELAGSYKRSGGRWDGDEHGSQHTYETSALTFLVDWTFFEWGKNRAEVRKAHHEKLSLAEQIKGIGDSIKLEVKTTFLNLNVAEKNIGTARESLVQAIENYRITDLQYQQQVTTSTEVLDAQLFLTEAETNYYSALYGYMIALAELERAVGGRIALN